MDSPRLKPSSRDGHFTASNTGLERTREIGDEFSNCVLSRPVTPRTMEKHAYGAHRKPRKIVLCFDGTGNKFQGDDSDSNILKIFRMLDRTASDQYHYYQPGIGTYVVSKSLSHTGRIARLKSWCMKAKDSAIGSSFDQHVVGGYRFLMRYYDPGDEIYIFGFSRGAYIARFLAEMLDYVGLLSHGNEEMVVFAWKAFANWQRRRESTTPAGIRQKKEMYAFMRGFRETFSRPVRRIRFLGLFDTVNSVPQFEAAWMERSKFPYTARTSAKVIRHAVSIDERRAKFRQDLIYQSGQNKTSKGGGRSKDKTSGNGERYRRKSSFSSAKPADGVTLHNERGRCLTLDTPDDEAPYRVRSHSIRSRRTGMTGASDLDHHQDVKSELSVAIHPHDEDVLSIAESEDESDQDIDEVWFAGGHADVGGGWEVPPDSKPASHIPLVWMVHEAMKAGLTFDLDKVREMGCMEAFDDESMAANSSINNGKAEALHTARAPSNSRVLPVPNIMIRSPTTMLCEPSTKPSHGADRPGKVTSSAVESGDGHRETFREMMDKACIARLHDPLEFGGGLPWGSTLTWKIMEYLPFRRMDLQPDGSWKPIRWPLPCGEVRDIPENARVHGSVIRRMQLDDKYRPGNLIVGGGGRGVRVAPKEYGIGDWVCVANEGSPVNEIWMKRSVVEKMRNNNTKN